MELRFANAADLPAIAQLINQAFSVELFFKAGDRITLEEVSRLYEKGRFMLFQEDGVIQGSVYVELRGERAYLGLLSTNQARQRSGIGTRLTTAAEEFARESGCRFMDLRIVNLREELRAIYQKFGYQVTGTEQVAVEAGQHFTKPAHFINMSKELGHR
ncbi:GNAT family N-acetyltransferase [Alloacidobacterium dinghuense]|uniref:GNAT family N-acetyltransferase n=1 Tax=Alloacidobacterium dinghuense TaxID=2763107 RepID=A0A7G8BJ18_9BACT|nr:GNAT family N-acetyltransferase [Alloacidobacterium dinghuense]QNI32538.1 GNAT family N-acetyltransferase [Alloacidobacterium dinghuense]